ncbi:hypothetical protein DPX16_3141 [Anabarilius grahami]|uniref:Uncharacterized protein n=1 Tax=Anabarilius grahami TaxID=495550 RepID=A0A3N0YZL4_ANAGA|nr:hypothetical protein DPX16_3141 [Anabarilius grahami]
MDSLLSSSSRSWAVGRLASRSHRSLQSDAGDASPFVDFRPPARDSISLPPHVLYVTAGLVLVVLATYAVVGHLINDLLHDLADWVFGPKAEAGDAERGSEEEEKVGMEEERAGLLPGFNSTDHLQQHYITSL